MTADRPRDAYPLGGVPWENRARDGELAPHDLSQAIAIAFSAACYGLLVVLEAEAQSDGTDAGRPRRAAYAALAERLGMSRDTFRLTFQGQRWLRLPEMQAVLEESDLGLGDLFSAQLTLLLRSYSSVMQTDGFSRPEGGPPDLALMLESEEEIPMSYVVSMEGQVRDLVRTMAALQARAIARGRPAPGATDWVRVSSTLGYGFVLDAPASDSAVEQLQAMGSSVAELVREALRAAKGPQPTYVIRRSVDARLRRLQQQRGLPLVWRN